MCHRHIEGVSKESGFKCLEFDRHIVVIDIFMTKEKVSICVMLWMW